MGCHYKINAEDSVLAAASRILGTEVENIARSASEIVNQPGSTDPLHDLRISVRKCRSAIKFFAPLLRATSAATVGEQLGHLNRTLGSARDFDAWLEYLQQRQIQRELAGNPAYEHYLVNLKNERLARLPELCFLLNDHYNSAFRRVLQDFIHNELAQLTKKKSTSCFSQFSSRRVFKLYNRIRDYPLLNPSSDEEQLHTIRRTCRKARYWAEFSVPEHESTSAMNTLASHFKGLATALGTTRDMQLHVTDFKIATIELPQALLEWHVNMEQRAWKKYRKLWTRLQEQSYHGDIKRALKHGR